MSKTLVQPVGQKRLTNVAVVRLRKHGLRFEIACFKNKVLSWRSSCEKDLDEVLQSHTVYSNVSKGVLAKSTDLIAAFGTDNQTKICLQILEKGELQVAGKEREAQLSSQFRDIATIVMEKTFSPETKRPYTISMIERLMHEIHFAVEPNSNSKKQALEVIRELQKRFPIKRSPMRLCVTVSQDKFASVLEKLNMWNGEILATDESGNQLSVVCELDPSKYPECVSLIRNLQGWLQIIKVSSHAEGDAGVDHYEEFSNIPSPPTTMSQPIEYTDSPSIHQLSNKLEKQSVKSTQGGVKQVKCSACNSVVGDAKQYRHHCKSEWHIHNLKRKASNLPPITAEECLTDTVFLGGSRADLKEYSF